MNAWQFRLYRFKKADALLTKQQRLAAGQGNMGERIPFCGNCIHLPNGIPHLMLKTVVIFLIRIETEITVAVTFQG